MKGLSIKARVTLLCMLLAVLILALGTVILLKMGQRLLENYCSSLLMSAARLAQSEIDYGESGLEIDRNLNRWPEVRLAVFDLDCDLIYGRVYYDLPFEEASIRKARGRDGTHWYNYDQLLTMDASEYVWLRCSVPADISRFAEGNQMRVLLWLGPLLLLLAGLGGYFIALRAFAPVSHMTAVTVKIADHADLSKRLPLSGPRDELYRLGEAFNGMLVRLEAAFERERRFSADAAHELRTPVAAILSQSEYALSEQADEFDRRAALEHIHSKAENLGVLIQHMMLLARMESGQITPELEPVELRQLCEMAVEALQQTAQAQDVRLRVICEQDITVQADATMLSHTLMNLIDNGIKYGHKGGFVCVSVEQRGNEAVLRVEDDGCGISEEQQAYIFERFYRADPSRQRSGAGLGLALCERIVALHGGRISVKSSLGEGSCFEVWLPK